MSSRMTGYLLASLAMMTVGSTVIASKLIAGHLPAFWATALRFAVAMPFLCALVIFRHQRWPRLNRREWGLLLLQAGAGSVGYTTLLISGLNYLPAADAGVIIGTLPAVSALFSVTVLGERPHGKLIASVLLATVGVVAVAWTGIVVRRAAHPRRGSLRKRVHFAQQAHAGAIAAAPAGDGNDRLGPSGFVAFRRFRATKRAACHGSDGRRGLVRAHSDGGRIPSLVRRRGKGQRQ